MICGGSMEVSSQPSGDLDGDPYSNLRSEIKKPL
jgi:hypothetical protein